MLPTAMEIYNLGQNTPLMSLEGILHSSNLLDSDRFFSQYLKKRVKQKYSWRGPIGLSTRFYFFKPTECDMRHPIIWFQYFLKEQV